MVSNSDGATQHVRGRARQSTGLRPGVCPPARAVCASEAPWGDFQTTHTQARTQEIPIPQPEVELGIQVFNSCLGMVMSQTRWLHHLLLRDRRLEAGVPARVDFRGSMNLGRKHKTSFFSLISD